MVVEYPIEVLSCWDKNAFLRNITQFPSDSANGSGVMLKAIGTVNAVSELPPVVKAFEAFDRVILVRYDESKREGYIHVYPQGTGENVWNGLIDNIDYFDIMAIRNLDGRFLIWCANGVICTFNFDTGALGNIPFVQNGYCISLDEINHRIIAVDGSGGYWYYSETGRSQFDWLGGYTAEFLNAKPLKVRRISNRLVVFTDKSVEFWDATDNHDSLGVNVNPFSTAYQQNVITGSTKLPSILLFGDNLYPKLSIRHFPPISLILGCFLMDNLG
jgi:hypothetical protein